MEDNGTSRNITDKPADVAAYFAAKVVVLEAHQKNALKQRGSNNSNRRSAAIALPAATMFSAHWS
jgi:hypothetical protein